MSTFTATPDSTQPSSREQAIASADSDNTLIQDSFSPHTGLRLNGHAVIFSVLPFWVLPLPPNVIRSPISLRCCTEQCFGFGGPASRAPCGR
jgi:hypothetical protein